MNIVSIKLTVFFEEPFWVGVFERTYEEFLETSRVVFGSEPKDYEVFQFVNHNFKKLKFSRPLATYDVTRKKLNPKRLQREIHKEVKNAGYSTKAQLAMKLEHEANKKEKELFSKARKEELLELKFRLQQEKKKKKRKGH
ncbi:YjdF family protein [Desulfotomaculum defluvii]